jgi:hypothetical protein
MKPPWWIWALAALVVVCAKGAAPVAIVIPENEPIRIVPVRRWE